MGSVSPSVSFCTLCDTLCLASSLLAVVPVVTLLPVKTLLDVLTFYCFS